MNITFKINRAGRLVYYRGKEAQNAMWEELIVPAGPSRAAMLATLDPVLLRATRLLFGDGFRPANYNEVWDKKAVVRQVMKDSPASLIPLYAFVREHLLSELPLHSVVQRFKQMLQREGVQDFKRSPHGGCYLGLDSKGRCRKDNDGNRFWSSYTYFDHDALSEAGWRYLLRLSPSTLREMSRFIWQWTDSFLEVVNLLGKNKFPAISPLEMLELRTSHRHCVNETSRQYFAQAMAERFRRENDPVTSVELDMIRDWFYEEKREITSGTKWETLVERAFTCAGKKVELKKQEMLGFQWTPPLLPFVADDGMMVLPFGTGTELLAEGQEMGNCLCENSSYAKRAVQGLSQVFSVRGTHGRASVEFVKNTPADTWRMAQLEGMSGAAVTHPVILSIVEKLEHSLRGTP
ncbi:MAG: hypothetical protein Q7S87_10160 [Agitococcus sp.]|nr:hypothetical protein [Agitococcus sp.]MDO9179309.1 hypothetical protein [Agitococcus sp.]